MSSGAWEQSDAAPVGNKEKKPAGDRQESAETIVAQRRGESRGHGEGSNVI